MSHQTELAAPSLPSLPNHVLAALFAILLVGGCLLVAVDVLLVVLLARDADADRPLFARRWSLAHVFLGLQAWLLATLFVALPAVFLIWQRPLREQAWGMLPILVLQNVAMAAVVAGFVRFYYDEPPASAGLSTRDLGRNLLIGAAVALVAVPVSDLIERLSNLLLVRGLPESWMAVLKAFSRLTSIQEFLLQPLHSPVGLAALVLVVGIIGPLGEEIFFRGFAHTALRKRFGPAVGAVGSAAFFAAIHLNPAGFIPILAMGLLLAILYDRTGTLAAPFALHAVNNTFGVIVAYFDPKFSFWSFLPGV